MTDLSSLLLKIILIGELEIKIMRNLIKGKFDTFPDERIDTIGMEPLSKMTIIDGREIYYNVYWVNNSSKYDNMRNMFLRGSIGAIYVFDMSSVKSFNKVESFHDSVIFDNKNLIAGLIGVHTGEDDVSNNQGRVLADSLGIKFYSDSENAIIEILDKIGIEYVRYPREVSK